MQSNRTHIKHRASTKVTNNPTEYNINSSKNTNITKNLTEQGTKVPKNQTEHLQDVRKALTKQTVNKTHTKQCTRHYRNKLSRQLIPNSAWDTNVTKSQQNT